MNHHSRLVEDVALALVLSQLREFSALRYAEKDLSMETVFKNMASQRGVEYKSLLPVKLASNLVETIQKSLDKEFDELIHKFPEAIMWEALQIVYGGDLRLVDHPGVQTYFQEKGITYQSPNEKFEAPVEEVLALKKAIFDQ